MVPPVRGVTFQYNPRTKLKMHIANVNRKHTALVRAGPQLYNLLPKEMRELENITQPGPNNVIAFKTKLDNFLSHIPDQPTTPGLPRQAKTNSLVDQVKYRTGLAF